MSRPKRNHMNLSARDVAWVMFEIIAPGARPKAARTASFARGTGAQGWCIEVHASPFAKEHASPIAFVYTGRIHDTARLNFVGHEFTFMPTYQDAETVARWVHYVVRGGAERHAEPLEWPFATGVGMAEAGGWIRAMRGLEMPAHVWTRAASLEKAKP